MTANDSTVSPPATTQGRDFASLGLAEPLLKALAAKNYSSPTPIQARCIPHLLQGRDLLGIAQTGTGKTAAFALPMLQLLHGANRRAKPRMPRALILAPTRELATQIADSCDAYGKHLHLRGTVVFGGVGQHPQVTALARGVDILIATPGRLLDLMQQRHVNLGEVEILVLDEADRMLDMGFLPDVKRILATLPTQRQSLLFSATMPNDITALAARYLRDPLRVEVTPPAATADRIEQSVHFVTKAQKRNLLVQLLSDPQFVRTLVFTRTKHGADRVVKELRKADIEAHAIHGNKSQNARERALDSFRDGKAQVLIATDIAARGIDVPDITHVINFDLPNIPESYVHRIGRTARAGAEGDAISLGCEDYVQSLPDIEAYIGRSLPRAAMSEDMLAEITVPARERRRFAPGGRGPHGGRGGDRGRGGGGGGRDGRRGPPRERRDGGRPRHSDRPAAPADAAPPPSPAPSAAAAAAPAGDGDAPRKRRRRRRGRGGGGGGGDAPPSGGSPGGAPQD